MSLRSPAGRIGSVPSSRSMPGSLLGADRILSYHLIATGVGSQFLWFFFAHWFLRPQRRRHQCCRPCQNATRELHKMSGELRELAG
jgi:hypothetical protein